jgi:GDP-D-mannose dehydratase
MKKVFIRAIKGCDGAFLSESFLEKDYKRNGFIRLFI